MKFFATELPGLVRIEPRIFEDDRGWFMETFNRRDFDNGLIDLGLPASGAFVQDNQSMSFKGVVRGLHWQEAPHGQGKLVRVARGAVQDVALDIRPESPTFGKWASFELSAKNGHMLWIPVGFAHGMLALKDHTHLLYRTTGFYNQSAEKSLFWNDPELNIAWQSDFDYRVSGKDQDAPRFGDLFAAP